MLLFLSNLLLVIYHSLKGFEFALYNQCLRSTDKFLRMAFLVVLMQLHFI